MFFKSDWRTREEVLTIGRIKDSTLVISGTPCEQLQTSQPESSHTQDECEEQQLTLHVGFGRGGAVVRKVLQDGGVPGEAQQHLGKDGPVSQHR